MLFFCGKDNYSKKSILKICVTFNNRALGLFKNKYICKKISNEIL